MVLMTVVDVLNSTAVGVVEGRPCPSWVMVLFARALEALATLARADDYRSNQQSKKDPLQKETQTEGQQRKMKMRYHMTVREKTIQQLKQIQMQLCD